MDSSDETATIISNNWLQVCQDVAQACSDAGRAQDDVTILGVSKYVDPPFAGQLVAAGCNQLGENRPQHLWAAHDALHDTATQPKWHMIGHLQRNKIRRTLPMLSCLHSLDSLRLAQALNEEAAAIDRQLSVLLEVNPTNDMAKTGLSPDEAPGLLDAIMDLPNLQVGGLMAMTTLGADDAQTQREFACVRELRDRLQSQAGSRADLRELSMGMSRDFPLAIAEGATIVRIGTRLWHGIL